MLKNLDAFLPEEISDESAYHLVNLFIDLATTLESHYFGQIHRYLQENRPSPCPDCLRKQIEQGEIEEENDF